MKFCADGSGVDQLIADAARRFGHVRLRVTGTSMLPLVRPLDILHVRGCAVEDIRLSDVVLFARQGRLFAHRVVAKPDANRLLTQGDTIDKPDPLVDRDEVVGRVERVERRGRDVSAAPTVNGRLTASLFRRSAMARQLFGRLQGWRGRV